MISTKDFYDKLYSENEVTFGKGKPEELVTHILNYKSSGSVLELGAGEGRNTLFLAEKGFAVTAQDISGVGIKKLKKLATEKNLQIQSEVKDIRNFNSQKNYDIFVCAYVFHHLSEDEVVALLNRVQAHTNKDGLNVITTFTENGDFYRNNISVGNFYPKENELKDLYAGWEILEYEEVETRANQKKPDGSPMMNVTAKLIARKPQFSAV